MLYTSSIWTQRCLAFSLALYSYLWFQGGLNSSDLCLPCKPKMHCTKYGVTEFTSRNGSGPCEAGFYCKTGVDTSRPNGITSKGNGGICTAGNFCPEGTDNPVGCPRGTFSSSTGLKAQAECTDCTAGHYCNETGLESPSGKKTQYLNSFTLG